MNQLRKEVNDMVRKCDDGSCICIHNEVEEGIEYCLVDGIYNPKEVTEMCERFETYGW